MTTHMINVTFDAKEGAMLRLLGLIQRRGFSLEAIDMPSGEGDCKTATLTLAPMGPGYRVETLQRQIERLHEVRSVKIIEAARPRNILSFLRKRPAHGQLVHA